MIATNRIWLTLFPEAFRMVSRAKTKKIIHFFPIFLATLYSLAWTIPNTKTHALTVPKTQLWVLPYKTLLTTQSSFNEKTLTQTQTLPFSTTYLNDPYLERGKEVIEQKGTNGKIISQYRLQLWQGKEIGRRLINRSQIEPTPQIIRRGTKLPPKLRVWAVSYDGNCPGCTGVTYTGKKVHHGICAVDPRIIPLGTRFYVPGYGECQAEDIGGRVKGKIIDLGFENLSSGEWSARYVTIEFLN